MFMQAVESKVYAGSRERRLEGGVESVCVSFN